MTADEQRAIAAAESIGRCVDHWCVEFETDHYEHVLQAEPCRVAEVHSLVSGLRNAIVPLGLLLADMNAIEHAETAAVLRDTIQRISAYADALVKGTQ